MYRRPPRNEHCKCPDSIAADLRRKKGRAIITPDPNAEISRPFVEAEIERLMEILNSLDLDPDLEDTGDDEPWLGAPDARMWHVSNGEECAVSGAMTFEGRAKLIGIIAGF